MKKFVSYFLQGLLFLVPIGATLYVIYLIAKYIYKFVKLLSATHDTLLSGVISFLIIVILIALMGFLSKKVIATPVTQFFDQLMQRTPIIRLVYSSVRDLMQAFVGKQRKFESPVLVRISSDSTVYRLGFITQNELSKLGIDEMISVYLPGSYGILGELIIVPRQNVKPIEANSAEVMKFIISGGITNVDDKVKMMKTDESR